MDELLLNKNTKEIKEIKEDNWEILSLEFKENNENPIYINNKYPNYFTSISHKKIYSCDICSRNLQSKIWFEDNNKDYGLACNHIKWVLISMEYFKHNSISNYKWQTSYLYPIKENQIKLCNFLINSMKIPNIKQTYFSDAIGNLDFLPPYPTIYDTIHFPYIYYKKDTVIKKNGIYYCTCSIDKLYKKENLKNMCCHCLNVSNIENKNQRIRTFILFLVSKYFL